MLMGPPDKGGEVAHSSEGCEGHPWVAGRTYWSRSNSTIYMFKTYSIDRTKGRN